ncbi:hypothetical protein D3C84_547000 [compost metagenome]
MHGATGEFDSFDAQRKRLGIRVSGSRLTRRHLEQTEQIELAVLGEQDFCLGFVQFDIGQVQRFGPEAVDLQVGVQAFEADLLLARFTDVQAPESQFKAERIELDPLEGGGRGGIVGQLLIGNA